MGAILVIESQTMIRMGLSIFFTEKFPALKYRFSSNIDQASISVLRKDIKAVVIGFATNGKLDHFKLAAFLLEKGVRVPIILLYENQVFNLTSRYMASNVKGVICKQNSIEELQKCISNILAGKIYTCKITREILFEKKVIPQPFTPVHISL